MDYPLRDAQIVISIEGGKLGQLAIAGVAEAGLDTEAVPALVAGILLAMAQELRRPTGEPVDLDTDSMAQAALVEVVGGDQTAFMRATVAELKAKYGMAHARRAMELMREQIEGIPIPAAILAAFEGDDEPDGA